MKEILKRPYIYWLIGIFLAYITLNVMISEFYVTLKYLPYYLNTVDWSLFVISILLTLTIASLISINFVYGYIRYKERKDVKKEGAMSCAATVGGLATGVCPACLSTTFPLLLGLFGITFSLGMLPFNGAEIQVVVVGLLLTSLYFLRKG